MKKLLISKLIGVVLGLLTPELLKSFADKMLDWVEDEVLESENGVDDALVLPLCTMIRSAFDIPDND